MMDFPAVVRRAWGLWWRTRALWPLGVLASCFGAGEAGSASFNFQQTNTTVFEPGQLPDDLPASGPLRALLENPLPFLTLFVLALIVLGLVFGLLAALAQGAMIAVGDAADREEPIGAGAGLRAGLHRAGPIFLVNLLAALPSLAMFVLTAAAVVAAFLSLVGAAVSGEGSVAPAAALATVGGALLCLIPLWLLAIVLSTVLSVLARLAQRACVIEGAGPLAGMGRAWRLARANLGGVALGWISSLLANLIVSAVISVPAALIAIPVGLNFLEQGFTGLTALGVAGLALYGVVVGLGLGGVYTSLVSASWTVLYRRCREP